MGTDRIRDARMESQDSHGNPRGCPTLHNFEKPFNFFEVGVHFEDQLKNQFKNRLKDNEAPFKECRQGE